MFFFLRPTRRTQKEPKLSRARQIPEWEEYDAEIARFTRSLADAGKIRSHIAAADANVLASAGAGGSSPVGEDTNEDDDKDKDRTEEEAKGEISSEGREKKDTDEPASEEVSKDVDEGVHSKDEL